MKMLMDKSLLKRHIDFFFFTLLMEDMAYIIFSEIPICSSHSLKSLYLVPTYDITN